MAYDVKFLRGTSTAFKAIAAPDNKTFYYLTDTDELYLGKQLLSNHPEVETLKNALETYKTDNDARVKIVEDNIGTVGDFAEVGATVSAAIVKLANDIKNAQSAGAVTVSTETTTEGMSKSYTFSQNGKQITVIDIPKDMVVSSGEVVKDPKGQEPGTYICLTLANATQDKIYINVAGLVDIYTAAEGATEIQLAFGGANGHEVSATLVDGGVSTDKIADLAVVTGKIADKNVTKAKLEQAVQDSLGKADTAVQTVAESTANGEILVDGEAVKVHGLGTAAYQNSDAFDAKDAAANVKTELLGDETTPGDETIRGVKKAVEKEVTDRTTAVKDATDKITALEEKVDGALGDGGNVATQITNAIGKLDSEKTAATGKAINKITQVDGVITEIGELDVADLIATAKGEAIDAAATDATTKANAALDAAKKYADDAVTWGTF